LKGDVQALVFRRDPAGGYADFGEVVVPSFAEKADFPKGDALTHGQAGEPGLLVVLYHPRQPVLEDCTAPRYHEELHCEVVYRRGGSDGDWG
jgi:hypothetical protein